MDKCSYHDELISQVIQLRAEISALKTAVIRVLITGLSGVCAVVGLGVVS